MSDPNPKMPAYGLTRPDEGEAIKNLERIFGSPLGLTVWWKACAMCDIERPGPPLEDEDFRRVVQRLAALGGTSGIAAQSLLVRLRSYEGLMRRAKQLDSLKAPAAKIDTPIFSSPKRLEEIDRLDPFSDRVRSFLRPIVREASKHFGVACLVNFVLDDAQFFASYDGLSDGWMTDAEGTPLEWAFCRYTVSDRKPLVITDASKNERVKDSPLVTGEGVRCYLGTPLITSRDESIGAICLLGKTPREFSDEDVNALKGYARETIKILEDAASEKTDPAEVIAEPADDAPAPS